MDAEGPVSTHGAPKDLAKLNGMTVQVMQNVYSGSKTDAETVISELVASQHAKRWKNIRANPGCPSLPAYQNPLGGTPSITGALLKLEHPEKKLLAIEP